MFKEIIFKNIPPSVNNFPSNRLKFSKDYSLIKEETSLFETLMLEMRSKNKKKPFSKCDNPNCRNIFPISINKCISCGNNFCSECNVNCENCNEKICKFCESIIYGKFGDIIFCPSCKNEYENNLQKNSN